MNKAITDGLVLMPPPFAAGLEVWSQGNGTPPTAGYDGDPNASVVSADADFAGCLELVKTTELQRVRFKGETPILPGCYLRVTARVKVISGPLPSAKIGAWAGATGGVGVSGVPEFGPTVALTEYGTVYSISAIVGTGARTGVDMPWGLQPIYGHFGVDFTGPTGGVLRIDDIEIEDVTDVFHRKMMDWVDVRDFGAIGDGVADDTAAFEAADAAAAGRSVLVPEGVFSLASSVTFEAPVRFQGTVVMPDDARLALTKNYDLDSYIAAFGDEVIGFEKAFQALLHFTDHDSLDMCGRTVDLLAPIDMQAAVGDIDDYSIRRVIRNGQFSLKSSTDWDTTVTSSSGTYSTGSPTELSGVANVASIPVGSLVEGIGVGREVYVRDKNVAAQRLTLSQPLHNAVGTQTYTFRRFKYALDFSGFANLDKFVIERVDFRCNEHGSGVFLPSHGSVFAFHDCDFTKPKDRAITSHGYGCQGMLVRRCQFLSPDLNKDVVDRTTIGINVNANDVKIQQCRAVRFKHFCVLHGSGHLIAGNHWFQGDSVPDGPRTAGIAFTQTNLKSTVTGNYIDNSSLEWTNEHDAEPWFASEFSFGGLSVTGNVFTVSDSGSWFRFLAIKPHGPDHFVQGLSVSDNVFKSLNGSIERVEGVDATIAPLDLSRCRNLTFDANSFNSVDQITVSPVTLKHDQVVAASPWVLDPGAFLPFGGHARVVAAIVSEGAITDGIGAPVFDMPAVTPKYGPAKNQIRLDWSTPCLGAVQFTTRCDKQI